jgi:hypothetical protein
MSNTSAKDTSAKDFAPNSGISAVIIKPAKTAMQSGTRNSRQWLVEFSSHGHECSIDPLMGWVAGEDTIRQLKMKFKSLEGAKAFLDAKSIPYSVKEPEQKTIRPKSYAANFAFSRVKTSGCK